MNKQLFRCILFAQAGLILVWFLYLLVLTNHVHVPCGGCALCGMTHAFRCMFAGQFEQAKAWNANVYLTFAFFSVLGLDLLVSSVYLLLLIYRKRVRKNDLSKV